MPNLVLLYHWVELTYWLNDLFPIGVHSPQEHSKQLPLHKASVAELQPMYSPSPISYLKQHIHDQTYCITYTAAKTANV